jgi:hypothetical protein
VLESISCGEVEPPNVIVHCGLRAVLARDRLGDRGGRGWSGGLGEVLRSLFRPSGTGLALAGACVPPDSALYPPHTGVVPDLIHNDAAFLSHDV